MDGRGGLGEAGAVIPSDGRTGGVSLEGLKGVPGCIPVHIALYWFILVYSGRLTRMVGWVLVVSVLCSPGMLPAERPSHL